MNIFDYPCGQRGTITSRTGEKATLAVGGNDSRVERLHHGLAMIFYHSGHEAVVKQSQDVSSSTPGINIQITLLSATPR